MLAHFGKVLLANVLGHVPFRKTLLEHGLPASDVILVDILSLGSISRGVKIVCVAQVGLNLFQALASVAVKMNNETAICLPVSGCRVAQPI